MSMFPSGFCILIQMLDFTFCALYILYKTAGKEPLRTYMSVKVVRGRFEITSTITPELYDTKSSYQLIVSIKNARLENLCALRGYIFNYQFCKQWRNSHKKNPFQCTWLTCTQSSCPITPFQLQKVQIGQP